MDHRGGVFAVDGSLGAFSAALLDSEGRELRSGSASAAQALEQGLALVAEIVGGERLEALSAIAVCTGPGAFTGTRIAISYAKALAFAARVPLVTVSSYDALEGTEPAETSLAVVPARLDAACARLRAGATVETRCGPHSELADWIVAAVRGPLTVASVAQGDLLRLAERGLHVRSTYLTGPAALRIARIARSRAPERSPHAAVADYGFPPAGAR